MLVRLSSSTSGEMVMLSGHLRPLFEIIGKECTARGVFTVEQLPEAIRLLQQAVHEDDLKAREEGERKKTQNTGKETMPEDDEGEEEDAAAEVVVSLGQRATPLIRLMTLTHQDGGFILWETEGDF